MTTSNDQEAPVSTDQTPTTGHDHTEEHRAEATQSWLSDTAYWRCSCGASGSDVGLAATTDALRKHLQEMGAQR